MPVERNPAGRYGEGPGAAMCVETSTLMRPSASPIKEEK